MTERLPAHPAVLRDAGLTRARGLVPAAGADLGMVVDHGGERIAVIDENGDEVPVEQLLLLFVALMAERGAEGVVAVPVTSTSAVERLAEGSGLEVVRTAVSLAALTRAATRPNVVFAGAADGSFIFPAFLPAPAASATVAHLLELLSGGGRPLSEVVAALPAPRVLHQRIRCPWALKGTLMRVLAEYAKDRDTDVTDGLKLLDEHGWVQVIPDPGEPIVHVYVEGDGEAEERRLEREILDLVDGVVASGGAAEAPAPVGEES
jgi:mannose-1-phosphate guanylyltransferase/phosphomannomutase